MDEYKKKWEESYKRGENWILSPKEEVVKFLNRFIRKRIGVDEFEDKIETEGSIKGLDFGCGIGRQVILLHQFGIEAHGVDISEQAISEAQRIAEAFGYPELRDRFEVIDQPTMPFADNAFDLVLSDSVLDSMEFGRARAIVKELDRIVDGYLYVSLISGLDSRFPEAYDGENIVQEAFEEGTVQSYFTEEKIDRLFAESSFKMEWAMLRRDIYLLDKSYEGRYYLVLNNAD
ncbi:MAG: class I SAM-dependent methyltransferase [Balneolaceae bacterium]|nr:class I SAM-dependent methyltransferase [Balneolaceae bacterium]